MGDTRLTLRVDFGANRSIEFMTTLGGVIGVANGALLAGVAANERGSHTRSA